jgi:4'-phosphopantetheinyl transferase EntD
MPNSPALPNSYEAVYKAWYPLAKRWLDFHEAVVAIDPDAGRFEAKLLVEGPVVGGTHLTSFSGRWLASRGLTLTAIALARTPSLPAG